MAQDPVTAQTATSEKSGSSPMVERACLLNGRNARMVGDLITVTISERTSTSVMAGRKRLEIRI